MESLSNFELGFSLSFMRRATNCLQYLMVVILAGCAAYRSAGLVQSGRRALLTDDGEKALAYFRQAADINPDYFFEFGLFREGIWTYVGRAEYQEGRLPEARRSLERALKAEDNDYLAWLYLGLTLARGGEESRALDKVKRGLEGLHDWLDYVNATDPFRAFWDPQREIRGEIKKALDMIASEDVNWHDLISKAEWVGRQMEEEIDWVRRDERRHFRNRDHGIRSGASIGVGVGF